MKKKLNLFCVLIFVALIGDILSMSNAFITGFNTGMKHGSERHDVTETSPNKYNSISLLPADMTETNAVTVTDNATGKACKVWPTQLMVPKAGSTGLLASMFTLAYTLAFGALAAAALVAFIMFVRNVNKNNIFTRGNITLLRWVGWCLVGAGIIVTADGCYDTYTAQQVFSLTGYVVDYGSAVDITNIIFGLFALVVAEAFAISLRMKEEQELTI